MKKRVAILPGDGIGPEVSRATVAVLREVAPKHDLQLEMHECLAGGTSIEENGQPLQDDVLEICKRADAVFLGAVGGPQWDTLPKEKRPEIALLQLRKQLDLFINLRPIKVLDCLLSTSPLKPEVIAGSDILIVRELTGGLYFGEPKYCRREGPQEVAVDTMRYCSTEIERIARAAFEASRHRRKRVTSVDKANILATSQLWRKTVERVALDYPEVELEHMLVDNCAMQLVKNPKQFDVILTENMFGDILSDEASLLTGSLGMLPSASLGTSGGLYEPVHGSAPDIAGTNLANPIAAISSVAMMFRHTFHLEKAALTIESAIMKTLAAGFRCQDLPGPGTQILGTEEMTAAILEQIATGS